MSSRACDVADAVGDGGGALMSPAEKILWLTRRAGQDRVEPRLCLGEAAPKPEEEREPSDQSQREREIVLEREIHRGADVVVVQRHASTHCCWSGPCRRWSSARSASAVKNSAWRRLGRRPRRTRRARQPRTRGSSRASNSAHPADLTPRTRLLSISDWSVSTSAAHLLGRLVRATAREDREPQRRAAAPRPSRSYDQWIVASSVCWRGSASRPPLSSRALPSRSSNCSGERPARVRPRARARAAGCRGARRAPRSRASQLNPGRRARARAEQLPCRRDRPATGPP